MTTLAELARRAVPYGLPTVDLHRILVNFALDPSSPEFKAPLNAVHHSRGLADPSDLSVVAMNVDTPYSWAWLDLRRDRSSSPCRRTRPTGTCPRRSSTSTPTSSGTCRRARTAHGGGRYAVRGPAGGSVGDEVDGGVRVPDGPRPRAGAHAAVRRRRHRGGGGPAGPGGRDCARRPGAADARRGPDRRRPGAARRRLPPCARLDAAVHADAARGRRDPRGAERTRRRGGGWSTRCSRARRRRGGAARGWPRACATCRHGARRCRSSAELFGSREFYAGDHLSASGGRLPRDPGQRGRGVPRGGLPRRRERRAVRRGAQLRDHLRARRHRRTSAPSGRSRSTTTPGTCTRTRSTGTCSGRASSAAWTVTATVR